MISIANPIPEPAGFHDRCRVPGNLWLKSNNTERPSDRWTPFRNNLADGFNNRCGFGAMWISSGTVDHFVSCDEDRSKAYEWKNYRYVEGWLNSSKKKHASGELLDPFEVQDDWFEVELPSLQLRLTDAVPMNIRDRAEYTITRLPLRDDERVVRQRRAWLKMYEDGAPLEIIRAKAPLIARAIVKYAWPQTLTQ